MRLPSASTCQIELESLFQACPPFLQFEAQEAARRADAGLMAVDPTPLREALAALPGHNFRVGACRCCSWGGVHRWVVRVEACPSPLWAIQKPLQTIDQLLKSVSLKA